MVSVKESAIDLSASLVHVAQMQVSDDEFAYLYADTQGGAGHKYHFIKDKRLFHSIEMRIE